MRRKLRDGVAGIVGRAQHMNTLAHLTSSAAGASTGCVLVVPVGATEQHGPHLPLSTDTVIALALAERLAAALPQRVVVAPSVAYGSSGEHQSFPGTLSIGGESLRLLLVELGRSATRTWPRVLLLSAHGGNRDAVNAAVARLRSESRDVRAWSPKWRGDLHAGWAETSVMLALEPSAVGPHENVVGETGALERLLPSMREDGVAAVSPSGVLGDPRRATAAAGEELLAEVVADLVSLVEEWR